MRGDVANPVDAGGFHRGVGVEPLVDGAGYECLSLFGQPVQKIALLLNQPVDPCRLLIQKPRNPPLRVERRNRTNNAADHIQVQTVAPILTARKIAERQILAAEPPVEVFPIDLFGHNGCK